jgi:hypothetical protein
MEKTKPQRAPQQGDKYIVRLPDGMRERIAEEAKANNRSMNAEIVARLDDSFSGVEQRREMSSALKAFVAASENRETLIAVQRQLLQRVGNIVVLALDLDQNSKSAMTQTMRDITRRFGDAIRRDDLAGAMEPMIELIEIGKRLGIIDENGQVKPEHEHLKPDLPGLITKPRAKKKL